MKWVVALIAFVLITLSLIFWSAVTAGHVYDFHHPMAIGEDDLGAAMFVLFWTSIAAVAALPIAGYLAYRFTKMLSKYWDGM